MTDPERTAAPADSLPPGWAWTTLENVTEKIEYGLTEKAVQSAVGPKFLRITDLQDGSVDWNEVPYCVCTDDDFEKYRLFPDDLVFARTGATTGKSYLITRCPDAVFASYLIRIRLVSETYPKYLAYFFQSYAYWSQITTLRKGSAQPGVNASVLAQLSFPLAPLNEQRRIVAAIEAQFTRLDAGVAALKRLQANLKRYKAAVLKAACEGTLVPQNPQDEPAAALLGRILAERRARWEADQRAKGKDPRKLAYPEPAAPDTSELPELPPGWVWASLDMLGDVRNGVTKGRKLDGYSTVDVPYLRVANVQNDYLDLSEIKTIAIKSDELEKYRLEPGDVLFNEGGDRDKLGRGVVWHGEIEDCIHQNHVHSVRLSSAEIRAEWVSFVRQTDYAREYFWRVASQTVNLASINTTSLRSLPVPIPPTNEQDRVLPEIDRFMSNVEQLGQIAASNLLRAERLRQSILKEAFAGRLVPQDPADEPAAVLLARIRQGRLEAASKKSYTDSKRSAPS